MISEKIKPKTREDYFIQVYQNVFPGVATYVRKMGGSLEEAKDIFQDALVIYYEKKLSGKFEPIENESVYITGIAKHLWYKHYRETQKTVALKADATFDLTEEPKVSKNILRFVELSGKKCLDLLTAFYYEKLNMKEMASRFGFAGERSATAQKYKCLEKVRDAIHERSLNKEDFYE